MMAVIRVRSDFIVSKRPASVRPTGIAIKLRVLVACEDNMVAPIAIQRARILQGGIGSLSKRRRNDFHETTRVVRRVGNGGHLINSEG